MQSLRWMGPACAGWMVMMGCAGGGAPADAPGEAHAALSGVTGFRLRNRGSFDCIGYEWDSIPVRLDDFPTTEDEALPTRSEVLWCQPGEGGFPGDYNDELVLGLPDIVIGDAHPRSLCDQPFVVAWVAPAVHELRAIGLAARNILDVPPLRQEVEVVQETLEVDGETRWVLEAQGTSTYALRSQSDRGMCLTDVGSLSLQPCQFDDPTAPLLIFEQQWQFVP